jgi:hypothetical protein
MAALTTLIAQHSRRFLIVDLTGVLGLPVPPGRPIVQEPLIPAVGGFWNNVFRVEHLNDRWHRIVSVFSDMVFDVAQASHASGAPIILWPWHGGPNQRFRVWGAPLWNNQAWGWSLEAQHSGKFLDVMKSPDFSLPDPLVQWDYHGGPSQFFRIFNSPIQPLHSELVLEVADGSQDNGAPIILNTFYRGPNQQFRLEYVPFEPPETHSSFVYRVVCTHSGKVWDIAGASRENGARLIQWDWHGGPNQLFELRRRELGGFSFMAKHSGKMIDVFEFSHNVGAPLVQWQYHGGANQRFQL